MNKKILILSSLFYPDTFGGGEKVLYYQALELIKRGYEVTVLTRKNRASLKDEEFVSGLRVLRYEFAASRFFGQSLADVWFLGGKIRKFLQAENFDCVISHYSFSSYGFYRAKVKMPSIYIFHASYYREVLLEGLGRKTGWMALDQVLKWLFARLVRHIETKGVQAFDRIVVESEYSRKLLHETYNVPEAKVSLINCGIDLDIFHPGDKSEARTKLNLPKSKFIIFTVRRLAGRMGLENLIQAVAELKDSLPDFLMIIGGQGVLASELKQLAQSLGLENIVSFAGFIPDKLLPSYYQAADLFVLPTLAYEGFGLVTLEALASGLPVLGTPTGATPEILGRLDRGYVLKGNQAEDISQGIKTFWQNYSQTDQAALSRRLRQFVEQNYSWSKAGDLLDWEIKKLLA